LEALRQAEAREELKQNNSGRRNPSSSSSGPPRPPTEPPPPPAAPRPPLPSKRKLSPTAAEPASPPNSSVPLLKRLKVSEEEHGELSISIPEIAASGSLPRVSPATGGGVGAALPATPLTSTGGSRARKKTGSFSVDAVQVSEFQIWDWPVYLWIFFPLLLCVMMEVPMLISEIVRSFSCRIILEWECIERNYALWPFNWLLVLSPRAHSGHHPILLLTYSSLCG
jgi:hypothetical protein